MRPWDTARRSNGPANAPTASVTVSRMKAAMRIRSASANVHHHVRAEPPSDFYERSERCNAPILRDEESLEQRGGGATRDSCRRRGVNWRLPLHGSFPFQQAGHKREIVETEEDRVGMSADH